MENDISEDDERPKKTDAERLTDWQLFCCFVTSLYVLITLTEMFLGYLGIHPT